MSKAGEGFQRKKNPEGPKEPTMGGGGALPGTAFLSQRKAHTTFTWKGSKGWLNRQAQTSNIQGNTGSLF